MNKEYFSLHSLIIVVITGLIVFGVVSAWEEPNLSPPGGNVYAPINTSDIYQEKAGGFWALGGLGCNNGLEVNTGNIYLGDVGGIGRTDGNGRINLYSSAFTNTYTRSEQANRITLHTDGIKFFTAPAGTIDNAVPWNERMRIANDGNVGIGSVSLGEKLEVGGDVYITGSGGTIGHTTLADGFLKIGDTLSLDPNEFVFGTDGYIGTNGAYNLMFWVNGAERMRIADNGNVGIGMDPIYDLDVSGDVGLTGDIEWSNGEITSDDNNTSARIIARAKTNLSNDNAIFAVESSGSATRFGVTQGYGGWFRDALKVGYTYDSAGLPSPTAELMVNGDVEATAYYYTSDIAFKENILPIENSLDKILKLEGVSFNWKENGEPSIGLIAQDVEKIFPEAVSGEEGEKAVNYGVLVAPLIESVKEQQKEIEELRAEIEELKAIIK